MIFTISLRTTSFQCFKCCLLLNCKFTRLMTSYGKVHDGMHHFKQLLDTQSILYCLHFKKILILVVGILTFYHNCGKCMGLVSF